MSYLLDEARSRILAPDGSNWEMSPNPLSVLRQIVDHLNRSANPDRERVVLLEEQLSRAHEDIRDLKAQVRRLEEALDES